MALDPNDKLEFDEQIESLVYIGKAVIDKLLKENIPQKSAKLIKAYYDAFIAEGFSEADSVQLAIAAASNGNFSFNKK